MSSVVSNDIKNTHTVVEVDLYNKNHIEINEVKDLFRRKIELIEVIDLMFRHCRRITILL